MNIHFLGTSAGVPSLRRGLPAVAVEREGELFLFDCGEGTQIAIQRSAVKAFKLAAVLISHMHGDHVMGLPGLLMSLQMAGREEPLVILGPQGLKELVQGTLRFVQARVVYPLHFQEVNESGIVYEADEYEIVAERLEHGVLTFGYALREYDRPGRFDLEAAQALGIPPGPLFGQLQRGEAVELPDGRRVEPEQVLGPPRPGRWVAYVTDTRPCDGVLKLARGCSVLIHEATFRSDRPDEARQKGHSTIADAASAAKQGGVRALALTHISPRYENADELLGEAKRQFQPVWIAEDGMTIELDRDGEVVSVTGGRRRG